MMSELIVPLILLLGGILFFILELFLPSGGILGLLSAGMIVGSVWQAFEASEQLGLFFLLATLVIVPIALVLGLTIMPKTPLVRRMILGNVPEQTPATTGKPGVDALELENLVGQTGKALSDLRPSGVALLEGRRLSVVSREFISSGSEIIVSRIEGNNIIVKSTPKHEES